uniref:Uncharacterized protein n=1 Tax=Anguilla anguilla TaxID=7936 RepID=A0A0E9TL72_ANGAN
MNIFQFVPIYYIWLHFT